MDDLILSLSDEKAEAVLAAMMQPLARGGEYETGLTPGLGRALGEAFGVGPGEGKPASEGDVARQALLVLAQDPAKHQALAALIEGDTPRSFSVGLDVAVIAGVLILLQTHVKIEKGKDGKTSWKIEKKPTSDKLLKPLIEKLLGWISLEPR
jgi:hypothetical protein